MSNINISKLIIGPIATNCYLIATPDKKALVIDPGNEAAKIIAHISERKLEPVAILNTHGHYDHIMANNDLKQKYKIPIYFPKKDQYLLPLQKELYAVIDFEVDHYFDEDFSINDFDVKVIETPGHTVGSSCFLLENKLFSGDMLFAGGYLGRTDLWEGSELAIRQSLTKLLELPDDTEVYPGHGPFTTIGQERGFYA